MGMIPHFQLFQIFYRYSGCRSINSSFPVILNVLVLNNELKIAFIVFIGARSSNDCFFLGGITME